MNISTFDAINIHKVLQRLEESQNWDIGDHTILIEDVKIETTVNLYNVAINKVEIHGVNSESFKREIQEYLNEYFEYE